MSIALQPDEHALSIPIDDDEPAMTGKLGPTKIVHGNSWVATARA